MLINWTFIELNNLSVILFCQKQDYLVYHLNVTKFMGYSNSMGNR